MALDVSIGGQVGQSPLERADSQQPVSATPQENIRERLVGKVEETSLEKAIEGYQEVANKALQDELNDLFQSVKKRYNLEEEVTLTEIAAQNVSKIFKKISDYKVLDRFRVGTWSSMIVQMGIGSTIRMSVKTAAAAMGAPAILAALGAGFVFGALKGGITENIKAKKELFGIDAWKEQIDNTPSSKEKLEIIQTLFKSDDFKNQFKVKAEEAFWLIEKYQTIAESIEKEELEDILKSKSETNPEVYGKIKEYISTSNKDRMHRTLKSAAIGGLWGAGLSAIGYAFAHFIDAGHAQSATESAHAKVAAAAAAFHGEGFDVPDDHTYIHWRDWIGGQDRLTVDLDTGHFVEGQNFESVVPIQGTGDALNPTTAKDIAQVISEHIVKGGGQFEMNPDQNDAFKATIETWVSEHYSSLAVSEVRVPAEILNKALDNANVSLNQDTIQNIIKSAIETAQQVEGRLVEESTQSSEGLLKRTTEALKSRTAKTIYKVIGGIGGLAAIGLILKKYGPMIAEKASELKERFSRDEDLEFESEMTFYEAIDNLIECEKLAMKGDLINEDVLKDSINAVAKSRNAFVINFDNNPELIDIVPSAYVKLSLYSDYVIKPQEGIQVTGTDLSYNEFLIPLSVVLCSRKCSSEEAEEGFEKEKAALEKEAVEQETPRSPLEVLFGPEDFSNRADINTSTLGPLPPLTGQVEPDDSIFERTAPAPPPEATPTHLDLELPVGKPLGEAQVDREKYPKYEISSASQTLVDLKASIDDKKTDQTISILLALQDHVSAGKPLSIISTDAAENVNSIISTPLPILTGSEVTPGVFFEINTQTSLGNANQYTSDDLFSITELSFEETKVVQPRKDPFEDVYPALGGSAPEPETFAQSSAEKDLKNITPLLEKESLTEDDLEIVEYTLIETTSDELKIKILEYFKEKARAGELNDQTLRILCQLCADRTQNDEVNFELRKAIRLFLSYKKHSASEKASEVYEKAIRALDERQPDQIALFEAISYQEKLADTKVPVAPEVLAAQAEEDEQENDPRFFENLPEYHPSGSDAEGMRKDLVNALDSDVTMILPILKFITDKANSRTNERLIFDYFGNGKETCELIGAQVKDSDWSILFRTKEGEDGVMSLETFADKTKKWEFVKRNSKSQEQAEKPAPTQDVVEKKGQLPNDEALEGEVNGFLPDALAITDLISKAIKADKAGDHLEASTLRAQGRAIYNHNERLNGNLPADIASELKKPDYVPAEEPPDLPANTATAVEEEVPEEDEYQEKEKEIIENGAAEKQQRRKSRQAEKKDKKGKGKDQDGQPPKRRIIKDLDKGEE